MYFVYVLRTSSDTLYIGQTNNLEKRIKEHKSKSSKSAKYIRYFKSFELVYFETYKTRKKAMKREIELKKWPRTKKDVLINKSLIFSEKRVKKTLPGKIMKIVIHINNKKDLDKALEVSKNVFSPSGQELHKYHDKNDWTNKIKNGGLLITALNYKKVIGFSICYPKKDKFHIWNVGVLKKYRKTGIWKLMHEKIINFAKENNFKNITLNTYKNKFPGMYNFVLQNGYIEYKKENDKSFFIKELK